MRTSLALLLIACGATPGSEPAPPTNPTAVEFDLHEWGLITATAEVVEVGAGPGAQPAPVAPPMVVEKPVVYVHADASVSFTLEVQLGSGYAVAERWPTGGRSLTWNVAATGGPCSGVTEYPSTCTSIDGYCETRELAAYETDDASCLHVGDTRAPLLFYRLRAEPNATRLPVTVRDGSVTAASTRTAWRVRRHADGAVQTWRVELGTEPTALSDQSGRGAPAAAAWMHHELGRHGLSDAERRAFERAWWRELFALEVDAVQERSVQEQGVVEETPPIEAEQAEEDIPQAPTQELLYFLEPAEIDAIARLSANPAPRRTQRVFVVRQRL